MSIFPPTSTGSLLIVFLTITGSGIKLSRYHFALALCIQSVPEAGGPPDWFSVAQEGKLAK